MFTINDRFTQKKQDSLLAIPKLVHPSVLIKGLPHVKSSLLGTYSAVF